MHRKLTVAAMVGIAVMGALGWTLWAQDMASSVWDGVYTQAQADRGQALYTASCAACHGAQLTGGETAPALAGGEFMSNWNGLPLGQLFERIRTGMPPEAPGKVGREPKVDILAYILSFNKFPAGDKELPRQTEAMNTIRFDAEKPKK